MTETFKYDVFLSHSAKDKPEARVLAFRLKGDELRVWFDEWEIKLRERVATKRQKIEQGLDGSRTLMLVMSRHVTLADWDRFVRQLIRFRDYVTGGEERSIILLRLDDVAIKEAWKPFLYDWRKRSYLQYAKLLGACRPPVSDEMALVEILNGIQFLADIDWGTPQDRQGLVDLLKEKVN